MVDILECLEMFFVVNNVPNEKKAANLLTLTGRKIYALSKSLIIRSCRFNTKESSGYRCEHGVDGEGNIRDF